MDDRNRTPGDAPPPPTATDDLDPVDALAGRFLLLAEQDFAGYCSAYDRIARALAADRRSLEVLVGVAPTNRTPVLALAATHHLALADPDGPLATAYREGTDPWPAFADLLHERAPEVRHLMATRRIQTNEVGRAAGLVPGLAAVLAGRPAGDDRPLALIEVGPSAGLNLLLDRFAITYSDVAGRPVATVGDPGSPVQLRCELWGGRPALPSRPLPIARREGLDVHPVDVTDDDACRWLAACVWPGVPDRPARLAAAIALARRDPPVLHRGDAVEDLPALLAGADPEVVPVVVATWALAYLSADGRRAVARAVDAVGVDRDVALLTAEAPQVTPWVPPVDPAWRVRLGDREANGAADGTGTVLGLRQWRHGRVDSRTLGLMHPHGRWLAWLDEDGHR